MGRVVGEWTTPAQAARDLGFDASHIAKCLKGKRSRHKGYSWRWSEGEVDNEFNKEMALEEKSFDYQGDKAILSAKTEKSITSLEEAIEFFEIDTEKWDVERFIVNSWDVTMKHEKGHPYSTSEKRTNYQVKVWLTPKQLKLDEVVGNLNETLKGYIPKRINYVTGHGTITVELADFHLGADIRELTRTPDFNVTILVDYLSHIVQRVNSYRAKNVIVNLHGDFFESISGLNHDDSWQSIGRDMFGANVIILANQIIAGTLLSKIKNLKEVNLVAGNHDRISAKWTQDLKGEGAKLLAFMLQKDFPKLSINFDSLVLVRKIDGINHIMTHGNHPISKKDLSKVMFDYGDTKLFNLWTEGHIHSRHSKKVLKSKIGKYDEIDFVTLDEQKYRKVVLPPLFTGNFYSESIGYSGYAGFVITFNNGKGIPNVQDFSI